MKKGMKYLIVLVLCVVGLSLFVACSNNDTAPAAVPTPAAPVTPAATPTPTPVAELPPAEPAAQGFPDLGGRVIRIAQVVGGNTGTLGPLSEDSEFFEPDPESGGYYISRLMVENRRRVEEAFNIVIEPIRTRSWSSTENITTARLAGELFADIIECSPTPTFTNMARGYIYPLDVLAERLHAVRPDVVLDVMTTQHTAWQWLQYGGHFWTMGRALPPMNIWGVNINLDIIDSIGAPNPVDLFNNGQWTWDAMRNIMEMATMDTDGDGVIDQWGLSGSGNEILRYFLVANDAYMIDPNTFQLGHNSPNGMQAMEFVYDIFANGWWMPGDPEAEHPARGSGPNNLAFGQNRTALAITRGGDLSRAISEGVNADWVPMPAGPMNTSGFIMDDPPRDGFQIVVGAEDPHYLLWILDELWSWSRDDWYELAFQGDHGWARGWAPNEDTVERIAVAATNNRRTDMGHLTGITGGLHNNLVQAWQEGTMTVAQAFEYFRPEFQTRVDEFFGVNFTPWAR